MMLAMRPWCAGWSDWRTTAARAALRPDPGISPPSAPSRCFECIKRTAQAEEDLIEIWVYIAQDNPAAADRLLDDIDAKCLLLARNPRLGTIRPDIAPELRYFPVGATWSFIVRLTRVSNLCSRHPRRTSPGQSFLVHRSPSVFTCTSLSRHTGFDVLFQAATGEPYWSI